MSVKRVITLSESIYGLVLAAGMSTRMGQPKMVLPWGKTTIIGQVVNTLTAAGISKILVVTGGTQDLVMKALNGAPINFVFNPDFENGEMINSIQAGIRALPDEAQSVLITLGDQPQTEQKVVRDLIKVYDQEKYTLILPSFNKQSGHPWLIHRIYWEEILSLKPPQTMRDFLKNNQSQIHYLNVQTDSILKDMDTPEEYHRQKPSETK